MDYIQAAGIILAIWAVLRSIGNERECGLREMEIRLREEAENNAQGVEGAAAEAAASKAPATPPAKARPK